MRMKNYSDTLFLIRQYPALLSSLSKMQRGIEKECLRINRQGNIVKTLHPKSLGSALTHNKITTDYSEALLEFIIPIQTSAYDTINELHKIHTFTYKKLTQQQKQELLWPTSMPCTIKNQLEIPIARYGNSNIATMKTTYRTGLGIRYSRNMQIISGVHYNFSINDRFWMHYKKLIKEKNTKYKKTITQFKTSQYLKLIRNFRRYTPLFIYLFGASPILSKSFLPKNYPHDLNKHANDTLYGEFATSLRMGDLGYQSELQNKLFISYNNIEDYIKTLRKSITKSHNDYCKLGIYNAQGYQQQLNTSLLQIENEFYSPIRPKRITTSSEAPINNIHKHGIQYVEIRCIDNNLNKNIGLNQETLVFLDILLLYCLFYPSPKLYFIEDEINKHNIKTIVKEGRRPEINIHNIKNNKIKFTTWALRLIKNMEPLVEILDSLKIQNQQTYKKILQKQKNKILNSKLTPSSRILTNLKKNQLNFDKFTLIKAIKWQKYFIKYPLSITNKTQFEKLAINSLDQQYQIDTINKFSFNKYLKNFFKQY